MVEIFDRETLDLVDYFLQVSSPFILFLITLFLLWGLQIIITQRAYLRYIFPEIRKHKLTYWAIGWVAIASHEILGHMIIGASTGARIDEVVVTPTAGHVTSTQEVSLLGWFSLFLQSLAPCFSPPMFMILLFYILFPNTLQLPTSFTPIIDINIQNIGIIVNTLTNLWNPYVLVFLYALIVTSLTAGASAEDVRVIVVRAIERPLVGIVLFCILLTLTIVFGTFGYDILPFLSWLVTLSFAIVMLGIAIATFIAFYLKNIVNLALVGKILSFLGFALPYIWFSLSSYQPNLAMLFSLCFGLFILIALRLLQPKTQKNIQTELRT